MININCKQCGKNFNARTKMQLFCQQKCKYNWRWHNVYKDSENEKGRRKQKHLKELWESKYYRFNLCKRNALNRRIAFDITQEEFNTIYGKPCVYCGRELQIMGIDRIDSGGGYVLNNCQSTCYDCNVAKHKKTHDEFIYLCNMISKKWPILLE